MHTNSVYKPIRHLSSKFFRASYEPEKKRRLSAVQIYLITAESFLFDVATATTEMERQRNRSSLARWLRLSDDVATATTEMERSGIEVAVLLLMPESFR